MTNQDWILLISSVVQVIAVLTAPLIALWVNQKLRDDKERKERKEFVFRTLMSTRATGLAQNHVQALNMIDVEFYGDNRKDKDVIEAWKTYHNFLSTPMSNQELWVQKREELLLDLLYNANATITKSITVLIFTKGAGPVRPTLHRLCTKG